MTTPRPLVVYGVGAIGGVIAARLRLAGFDVTAVARGEHLSAIRARGLTLVTQAGTDAVALPAAASARDVDWSAGPVVILAVKSHQTASALDDLSAYAPPGTAVFVAQNGVANEPAALRSFANVYGVTVMLPAAHLDPGVVIQQSHPVAGILDLGRYPTGHDEPAEQVAATLRASGFHSSVRGDVMAWKYRKLIANLGNGVIAAYRPGPDADELVARARTEAEHVLTAAGISFVTAEQDALRRGDLLQGRVNDDYLSSTWQSVARGHTQVETDWFNGEIVLQARLHGLRAPVNEMIQRVTAEHARVGRPVRSLDATAALKKLGPESQPRQSRPTQPAGV
ncbi:ketopantoate reductase family protein [Mycolicibacterium peregrinum]|uniref:ketopantoate reductase family protein n=1 Tax=Mycolicibacterium peregrinum TaxID=43304 RepID=UPI0006D83EAC|nr:2-dehydropantoate 2-reductase N-terminal domain-containing protein [Mycolicibacterium peregrinum]MCV7201907.1 ketopantoate reductase family protein [Mycolicibacterium peregrinum]ORW61426.1 2-dehydropantoate 2-reductase [Mycolicibacterium peregrinum]